MKLYAVSAQYTVDTVGMRDAAFRAVYEGACNMTDIHFDGDKITDEWIDEDQMDEICAHILPEHLAAFIKLLCIPELTDITVQHFTVEVCLDCGELNERRGHMGCQYPS
jgi:hypothetical protein